MRCTICGEIVPLDRDYCSCFSETIEEAPPICEKCATGIEKCRCGEGGFIFSHFTSVFVYDGLVKAKIHNLKFNSKKREADFFFEPMSEKFKSRFPEAEIDAVTFVPITKKSRKQRGFNQSELLAKGVAKELSLPILPLLFKKHETEAQHSLGEKERRENIKNAFEAINKGEVEGKTVLLIDDIKTTGATLFWSQNALFDAGAKDVFTLTAAVSRLSAADDDLIF